MLRAMLVSMLTLCGCPGTTTEPADLDGDGDGWAGDFDCNDSDSAIHPNAEELCDEVDNDCDGIVDEAGTNGLYADEDGDGFGNANAPVVGCAESAGAVLDNTDCDDGNSLTNPGVGETCDGIDNDCNDGIDEPDASDAVAWYIDEDGDGFGAGESEVTACDAPVDTIATGGDCDDADPAISPDAVESCDGVDNDCDGSADEDDAIDAPTWFFDDDGDTYGIEDDAVVACEAPADYAATSGDCNDSDFGIHPGAEEHCDSIDEDCDELLDDDPVDGETYFADTDGDLFGSDDATLHACVPPDETWGPPGDCDDTDADVNPDAVELCSDEIDNDCDGDVNEEDAGDAAIWYLDGDGDGHGDETTMAAACEPPEDYVASSDDCDDANAELNPGTIWYQDADSDGYFKWVDTDSDGVPEVTSATKAQCEQPTGYLPADESKRGDCAEVDPDVHPGADELCDTHDNDCDGVVDEGNPESAPTWYLDEDGDGHGVADLSQKACSEPVDYSATSDDCDDTEPTVFPGADELCNGLNDNCDDDGLVDEDPVDGSLFYVDADGDGFGASTAEGTLYCAEDAPAGTVSDHTDCDDTTAAVNPNTVWYLDVDGDGYYKWVDSNDDGTPESTSTTKTQCTQPSGYVLPNVLKRGDCEEYVAAVNPSAIEQTPGQCADSYDNDCDGLKNTLDPQCPTELCTSTSDQYLSTSPAEPWSADRPYHVQCNLYIGSSSTSGAVVYVTVTAGAKFTFSAGKGLYVGKSGPAVLNILGEDATDPSTRVVMTSDKTLDPTLTAAKGDWTGLVLLGASDGPTSSDPDSTIRGLVVDYAGGSSTYPGGIYTESNDDDITKSLVEHSDRNGIYAKTYTGLVQDTILRSNDETGYFCATTPCLEQTDGTFSGNVIQTNGGFAAWLYPNDVIALVASDPLHPEKAWTGNGSPYVRIGAGTASTSAFWDPVDVPYYVDGEIKIEATVAPTITLSDGVEMYFTKDGAVSVGPSSSGDLVVDGTDEGVLMTRFGGAPTVDSEYWLGVTLKNVTTPAEIIGLTLQYGGRNASGGLYLNGGDAVVIGSTFEGNLNDGARVFYGGLLDASDSAFIDNRGYGLWINDGDSSALVGDFTGSTATGNGKEGVAVPISSVRFLDNSSTYGPNTYDQVRVGEGGSTTYNSATVRTNQFWQALDTPHYFVDRVDVYDAIEPTLELEPGFEGIFAASTGISVGDDTWNAGYKGALVIDGLETDPPVVLRGTTTTPGSWLGVYVGWASTARLSGFEVDHGGLYTAGVQLDQARNVEISNCAIVGSAHYGIRAATSTVTKITDCDITGTKATNMGVDGVGVSWNSASLNGTNDLSNTNTLSAWARNTVTENEGYPFEGPAQMMRMLDQASTYTGNGFDTDSDGDIDVPYDRVRIIGGTAYEGGTWQALPVPWYITASVGVGGPAGGVIMVSGATFLFAPGTEMVVAWAKPGNLDADNCLFTSAKTAPAKGDWKGITFDSGTDSRTRLTNSTIEYAGSAGQAVYIIWNRGTYQNNFIHSSSQWGLHYKWYSNSDADGQRSATISGTTYGTGDQNNTSGDYKYTSSWF